MTDDSAQFGQINDYKKKQFIITVVDKVRILNQILIKTNESMMMYHVKMTFM